MSNLNDNMYITETIMYRKNFWCKFVIMDDFFYILFRKMILKGSNALIRSMRRTCTDMQGLLQVLGINM